MYVLIEAKLAAEASGDITVGLENSNYPLPATLYAIGALDGVEEIPIQYWDGAAWRNSAYALSVASPQVSVYTPGTLRLNKPITVNQVGVGIAVSRAWKDWTAP